MTTLSVMLLLCSAVAPLQARCKAHCDLSELQKTHINKFDKAGSQHWLLLLQIILSSLTVLYKMFINSCKFQMKDV